MPETTSSNNCCYQTLSIIQTCPGTTRFGSVKIGGSLRSPNLGNPEFQSKRKGRALPFGAGYTKCQPDTVFLEPLGAQKLLCYMPPVRLQHSPGVA